MKTDFFEKRKKLLKKKKTLINSYISPKVNHTLANELLRGIDLFISLKLKTKTQHYRKNWQELGPIHRKNFLDILNLEKHSIKNKEHDEDPHWDVIITNEPLQNKSVSFGKDMGNIVVSMMGVETSSKSFLLGYHLAASAFSKGFCTNHHCIHTIKNLRELNAMEAIYDLTEEIPKCDYHREWKI